MMFAAAMVPMDCAPPGDVTAPVKDLESGVNDRTSSAHNKSSQAIGCVKVARYANNKSSVICSVFIASTHVEVPECVWRVVIWTLAWCATHYEFC